MASEQGRIPGDFYFPGNVTFKNLTVPDSTISRDAQVAPGVGVAATKLQHRPRPHSVLCDHATSAAVKRQGIYTVYGATATLWEFIAWASVAATSTGAITIDLLKNGTSILTAPITLNSSITALTSVAATIASTALVAGDKLEVSILTATGSTLPKGVNCELTLVEDAQ